MTAQPLGAVAPLADHHRLEEFDCGVPSLDRWLQQSACIAAAAGTAATYVAAEGDHAGELPAARGATRTGVAEPRRKVNEVWASNSMRGV